MYALTGGDLFRGKAFGQSSVHNGSYTRERKEPTRWAPSYRM